MEEERPRPPQEEDNTVPFDHPLLDKLSPIDKMIVLAHFGTIANTAYINAKLEIALRFSNFLHFIVGTSAKISDEQKQILLWFRQYILEESQKFVELATGDDNA